MGKILDGFPWWGQLSDPDPRSGRPDIFASTDCGEEVVSMWLACRKGVYTDAADLRRQLPGPRTDGETVAGDLVYLLNLHGISAGVEGFDAGHLKSIVHETIDQGLPLAALGYWIVPTMLHWVLGVGYGNDAFVAMDPWTGRMVVYRWRIADVSATGQVVRENPASRSA